MKSEFFGFNCEEIEFEGRRAFIAFPDCEQNGRIALKTEYWGAFPELETELLKRGFHVIGLINKTRLATKEDCDVKARFVNFVSEKYSLDKRCVLVGMSCGGAQAINFSSYYKELASVLVIDAPVVNFLDFPGRYDKFEDVWENEFKVAYPGVKRSDIFMLEQNPINRVPEVIKAKLPVIMLYGTEDNTVDYSLNGRLLEEAYSENKELLTVIKREFQGHHPHGLLKNSYKLADMVMEKLG